MVENSLDGRLNPDDSMELTFPGLPFRAIKKAPKEEVPKKVEVKVNKVWVWRPKSVKSPWQRFFVVVEEGELKTYKDDKARCPLECVHLGGSSVKEVSTSSREEVRPHKAAHSKSQNRHHNKAITIWVEELHVDGLMLVNPTRVGLKRVEICFALEKAEEHSSFLSQLQSSAQCEPRPPSEWTRLNRVATESLQFDGRLTSDGWDPTLFCPSEQILMHLCTTGLAQSAKLLEALRGTRLVLTQHEHGWSDPLELCKTCLRAFTSLQMHIKGMQEVLARHFKKDGGK
eukprot:jgi/Botrbrau1/16861/Bobra.150_2s0080.2